MADARKGHDGEGPATRRHQIFYHRDYFTESLEAAFGSAGTVGTFYLRVDQPENISGVIEDAEAMFTNSTAQVKAETESAFELSFTEMLGNVQCARKSGDLRVPRSFARPTGSTASWKLRSC